MGAVYLSVAIAACLGAFVLGVLVGGNTEEERIEEAYMKSEIIKVGDHPSLRLIDADTLKHLEQMRDVSLRGGKWLEACTLNGVVRHDGRLFRVTEID